MRWLSIAILLMVVFAFSPAKSAQADDFSFSIGFHDELSPYGSWLSYSSYGNVWRPYGYANFHPYSNGYWGYTNYGPTWNGYDPYSSYTDHYGYWIYTARYGWVWVPGYDWHPGRVSWSYGGGYIGWRPLFPSGYHYPGNDYNFWVVIDSDRFGYRNYSPYRLGRTHVRDLFARRVFRERYNTFRRAELERIVRRPVRVLSVRERTARIGDRRSRILVTDDDERRIRKQVTQIRGRGDNRRTVERDTVLKRKFDDIRNRSDVRRSDSRRVESDRSRTVRKSDNVRTTKQKVEKSRSTPRREIEKRSTSRSSKSTVIRKPDRDRDRVSISRSSKSDRDRVSKARLSSRDSARERVSKARVSSRQIDRDRGKTRVSSRQVDRDRVSKSRLSSRSSGRERATVRKTEVRSRSKAEVSKRPVKKQSTRKQKPRDRRN